MLVVTHVPKTGGTSFLLYLRQVFGWRLFEDYPATIRVGMPWWRRLLGSTMGPAAGRWGSRCIVGHFLAHKFDRDYPSAQHAVWLRDPVQRLVSHYHYFMKHSDCSPKAFRPLLDRNPIALRDFVELPRLCSRQARQLRGKPLSRFDFIGITEHFETGMQLFARVFDLPAPRVVPHANQNAARQGQRYELEPGLEEHIRSLHRGDEELYREGLERFEHLCRAHGLDVPAAGRPAA